ncbi:MAG: TonB-dependent receptor [Acidobacteriota bacterium]
MGNPRCNIGSCNHVLADSARLVLLMILLVGFLAAPLFAKGTGSLTGVISGPGGVGLQGASVMIVGEAGQTTSYSGERGVYRSVALEPGLYDVTVELDGFEPTTTTGLAVAPGSTSNVDFQLALRAYHEVVTVIGESPLDTVEAAELREGSARDVGEALTRLPGVWKIRKGAIASDLNVRGSHGADLNVLIDGQRLYGACPNGMDPTAFHVDFAEVDRVEVSKGPFDIRNAGSLGGVVNVWTRDAEAGTHARAAFTGGSWGAVNPGFTLSYGGESFSAAGGVAYRRSGVYEDGSGIPFTQNAGYKPQAMDTDAYRAGAAWLKGQARIGEKGLLDLSVARQRADHVLYPYLQMDGITDTSDRFALAFEQANPASGIDAIRARFYYTSVDHWMTDELRISSAAVPAAYKMATQADSIVAGGRVELCTGGLTCGIELADRRWSGKTSMYGMPAQASIPDARQRMIGPYAEYTRPIQEKLVLTLGGRVDGAWASADFQPLNQSLYEAYHGVTAGDRSNALTSGSARLVRDFRNGLELSAGIGHSVRQPDPEELYVAIRRSGTDWVGNPSLDPTSTTGVDVTADFSKSGFASTVSLFYDRLGNYIQVYSQPRQKMIPGIMNKAAKSFANLDARRYGAEVAASFPFTSSLSMSASVSLVRGIQDTMPDKGIKSSDMSEIPPAKGRLLLRYDQGRIWTEAEGIFGAAQDNVDTDLLESPTPGYAVLNLRGGWRFRSVSAWVVLDNIFNRTYYEYLSYQRDPFRSGFKVPEPGRTITLGLTWNH